MGQFYGWGLSKRAVEYCLNRCMHFFESQKPNKLTLQAQKQNNWHDCGPHILAFFLLKGLGSDREITPPGMANFRLNIQLQLIRGSIFLDEYSVEPLAALKTPRAGLRKFKSYKRL